LQQQSDLPNRLGQSGQTDAARPVSARQVPRKLLQDSHVFRVTARNVRFEYLEHTPLPAAALGIAPGETNHRADTSFRENGGVDLNLMSFKPASQLVQDNGPDLIGAHIRDAVLEFRQGAAQGTR